MSDRHVVEKTFNELLEDYRTEILPFAIEDWDALSEVEQAQIQRMNNFFCGLHFITGLADSALNKGKVLFLSLSLIHI